MMRLITYTVSTFFIVTMKRKKLAFSISGLSTYVNYACQKALSFLVGGPEGSIKL